MKASLPRSTSSRVPCSATLPHSFCEKSPSVGSASTTIASEAAAASSDSPIAAAMVDVNSGLWKLVCTLFISGMGIDAVQRPGETSPKRERKRSVRAHSARVMLSSVNAWRVEVSVATKSRYESCEKGQLGRVQRLVAMYQHALSRGGPSRGGES